MHVRYSSNFAYRAPRRMYQAWKVKDIPLQSIGHAGERIIWTNGGNKMG